MGKVGKIEEKRCKFSELQVKKDNENLYVEGYSLVYGNVDSYKDIIAKGAVSLFLESKDKNRIKFCYQHDMDKVIGKVEELRDDDKGLWFRARISNTTLGKDVALLIEDGAIDEFSISYTCNKSMHDESTGIRTLLEIYIYEISPVTRAANEQAIVVSMQRKSEISTSSLENRLKELKREKAEIEEELFIRYLNNYK